MVRQYVCPSSPREEHSSSKLSAPNITAQRSASRSAHHRDRGTPGGCRLGTRNAPSAAESGSPTRASSPPTCIVPASRRTRCPAGRCVGLCPSSSRPPGTEGSRSLCRHGASSGASSADHGQVCASGRRRPRPPQGPWSRGRWQPCGPPRAGCPFGRPQHGASSPSFPYLSDSCRSFGPPGGGHTRRVQRSPLPVDLLGPAQTVQELSVQLFPHDARLVPLLEASPAGHP